MVELCIFLKFYYLEWSTVLENFFSLVMLEKTEFINKNYKNCSFTIFKSNKWNKIIKFMFVTNFSNAYHLDPSSAI